ncbi:hypothetical protein F5Y18DRAFT_76394 [Xylariaceae sp. FL1019]|nr:hypothetical protein F5Y18DRAFT_76394 [Xylariaceae sp. FL1019]
MSSDHRISIGSPGDFESSAEPLMGIPGDSNPVYKSVHCNHSRYRWIGFHCCVVVLYISILTVFMSRFAHRGDLAHARAGSPADSFLQYEMTYFDKYAHLTSPFSKAPGPGLDAVWHEQLLGMNIRVTKDWLEPFGVDSVRFRNSSDVLVQLGIYHELHCLKKLKHWIHYSHDVNTTSDARIEEEAAHIEHCLEWLRIAALCRGDTTLSTFRWSTTEPAFLETEYPIPRQCVKPESLLGWAKQHAVDITRSDLLERPKGA